MEIPNQIPKIYAMDYKRIPKILLVLRHQAERNRGLESFTAKPMAWGNQAKAELKRGNLDFKGNQGDGSKHNKVAMRLNTHPTVKPKN